MKLKLTTGDGSSTLYEGSTPQTPGLILRCEDNNAELQIEWNAKELRISGDGGKRGWEVEVVVPRERSS